MGEQHCGLCAPCVLRRRDQGVKRARPSLLQIRSSHPLLLLLDLSLLLPLLELLLPLLFQPPDRIKARLLHLLQCGLEQRLHQRVHVVRAAELADGRRCTGQRLQQQPTAAVIARLHRCQHAPDDDRRTARQPTHRPSPFDSSRRHSCSATVFRGGLT